MPTKYLMFKSLAIMLSNIMQLPKMNNNIYICLYLDLGRCLTESLKKTQNNELPHSIWSDWRENKGGKVLSHTCFVSNNQYKYSAYFVANIILNALCETH
jgi:hypothetical protein